MSQHTTNYTIPTDIEVVCGTQKRCRLMVGGTLDVRANAVRAGKEIKYFVAVAMFVQSEIELRARSLFDDVKTISSDIGVIEIDYSDQKHPIHSIASRPDWSTPSLTEAMLALTADWLATDAWPTLKADYTGHIKHLDERVTERERYIAATNSHFRGMHLVVSTDDPLPDDFTVSCKRGSLGSGDYARVRNNGNSGYTVVAYIGFSQGRDCDLGRIVKSDTGYTIVASKTRADGIVCASLRAAVELMFRDAIGDKLAEEEEDRRREYDQMIEMHAVGRVAEIDAVAVSRGRQ